MSPVREDGVDDIDEGGVFFGLDVGKSAHHGHGLAPAGKKVFDKQLPNSEPKLRAVFEKLAAKFGTVLVGREPSRHPPRCRGRHPAAFPVDGRHARQRQPHRVPRPGLPPEKTH
ncbi:transposase [Streptomyces sp. NPDC001843]|uniref:IS110 family transposase n=1 Tax=Streptomyces sp. NPDC001843 TaxID=3364617 RepID=UPI0036B09274